MTTVSFSEASTFQICLRQYYYRYTLGLAPMNESSALQKGWNGHKMLETFYKALAQGMTKEQAVKAMQDSIPEDIAIEWAAPYLLVKRYIDELDLSEIETVLVEKVFKLPIADVFDLNIGFTPDLVKRRKGSKLELEDYKFVGRMWPQSKLARYPQLNLYNIFLAEAGYNIYKSILRFFNVSTGKISYKVYDPSDEERRILRKEFLLIAIQIQDFKERSVAEQNESAVRTLNYNTCQYCPFVFPCSLEAQGKDASNTLATQYRANIYGYEQ